MKKYTVQFKFDHGQIVYHISDTYQVTPLIIIQQQGRAMTDGTMTKWYGCRVGAGNIVEYAEIELEKKCGVGV